MKKIVLITTILTTAALYATPLYTACAGCHGARAEKKAMGKSRVIQTMKKEEIVTALKGYQNGSYGGTMKAVMKGQAGRLSDADIKALAEYIPTLK